MRSRAPGARSGRSSRGARAESSPSASLREAMRSSSIGLTIQWATSRAPITAERAEAAETARILTSSCMWNITQPEARTAPSGSATARNVSPISWRRTVGSSRTRSAAAIPITRVERPRTIATSVMGGIGSRSPRPSRCVCGCDGIGLDLFAETADVHRQRPGVERGGVAPDPLHQLLAGEDVVRVRGEEPEQVELLDRQGQLVAGVCRLAAAGVESCLAELERLGGPVDQRCSAEHGSDAGGELAWRERLGHVVVGAELEADDPVGLVAAGRQQDHRQVAARADPAHQLQPVGAGQHDVEHDELRLLALEQTRARCRRRPPRAPCSRRGSR